MGRGNLHGSAGRGAMSVVPQDPRRVAGVVGTRARRDRVLMRSARVSHVGVKGATCDLSELDLRSQRRRVAFGGDTFVPPQDARRGSSATPPSTAIDGGTPRHLLCAAVYSARSQLPLEGTERDNMAQMVKLKVLLTRAVPH